MKIVYITNDNSVTTTKNGYTGVMKKVISQISELRALGMESELLILNENLPESLPKEIDIRFKKTKAAPYKHFWEKIRSSSDIAQTIGEEIKSSGRDTVLYIRGMLPTPKMVRILRKQRKCRVILELQSFAEREAALRGSWETVLAMKLFNGKVLRYADGIVGVTNEIALHYFKMSKRRNLRYLVNGNGIDVESVPLREPPVFDKKNLDLLCVAQVAKWHGLDRLIRGMADYNGNVNVRLHIVGDGSEVSNLKKLVTNLKLGDSVFFHGFKTGKELDELFDKCHIAVGSLALHRAGITEGSVLKAREYCARGIPFIYGTSDADFCEDFPYLLRIPANESPIDISSVFAFADRVLANSEYSIKMREYAEENLDWSIKMKRLVEFMNEISEGKVMN